MPSGWWTISSVGAALLGRRPFCCCVWGCQRGTKRKKAATYIRGARAGAHRERADVLVGGENVLRAGSSSKVGGKSEEQRTFSFFRGGFGRCGSPMHPSTSVIRGCGESQLSLVIQAIAGTHEERHPPLEPLLRLGCARDARVLRPHLGAHPPLLASRVPRQALKLDEEGALRAVEDAHEHVRRFRSVHLARREAPRQVAALRASECADRRFERVHRAPADDDVARRERETLSGAVLHTAGRVSVTEAGERERTEFALSQYDRPIPPAWPRCPPVVTLVGSTFSTLHLPSSLPGSTALAETTVAAQRVERCAPGETLQRTANDSGRWATQ